MKTLAWMLPLIATLSCAPAPSGPDAIEGTFVLEEVAAGQGLPADLDESVIVNPLTGGIADLFIYLRTPPPVIDPAWASKEKEVVIESRGGEFHPRAAVVRTDQVTRWTNSDPTGFLLQMYGIANSNQVFFVPREDNVGVTMKLPKAEPIPMPVQADCDPQHAGQWMRLLVVDHPFAAVTDRNGRFRIEGLPPGEHSFRVWHSSCGWIEKDWKVVARPGQTLRLSTAKVAMSRLIPRKKRGPE